MHKIRTVCFVLAFTLAFAGISQAIPVYVDTVAADFSSLLGGSAYAVGECDGQ